MKGKIISQIAGVYSVFLEDGNVKKLTPKGKFRYLKIKPIVGDNVEVDDNQIIKIYDRSNSLIRPCISNIDVGIVVVSMVKPEYSSYLLDKLLVLMYHHNITPVICITKYDLLDKNLQLTLSVSLHAPNDEIRSKIMPVNNKWVVDELLKACKLYGDKTSRRISFEYAMMKGVNDTPECAKELALKLKGILCHINLIPANEVAEKSHKRSADSDIENFKKILEKYGHTVTIRRTLGSDINASCGQLRREKIKEDNNNK